LSGHQVCTGLCVKSSHFAIFACILINF
jgi:hypothetical protein